MHPIRRLAGLFAAAGVVAGLLAPLGAAVADESDSIPRRELAGAWLAREADKGVMPGPTGRSDWGLTVESLFALYASGVGESAASRIEAAVESHAGAYLGPDLYRDPKVRLGGSAAALLTMAVVTGNDPRSFGHGRYARAGDAYDLRAEVLDLVASRRSAQPGRIQDRGTGSDSTNTFSQALAVVGLARSGGGHGPALEFLLSQQCRGGYFRMFYNDAKTCDRANGTPDIDGTAVAVEALVTARANGSTGLTGPIARARAWLEQVQRPDGSFGGVGSSEPPNANTTGLAARALHSTGSTDAYREARRWVARLQIGPRRAFGALHAEAGAIAYDPAALAGARRTGIDDNGRDQWRRATAQATYALAPTSLARLGRTAPEGNPRVPESGGPGPKEGAGPPDAPAGPDDDPADQGPPADQDPPAGDPDDNAGEPDRDDDADEDREPRKRSDGGAASSAAQAPAARLGGFITDQLVDGNHVEVRQDGERYVDYDLTADAVIALRVLGVRPDAAQAATEFLLREQSVAAYAHGAPYEKRDAAYAEPLAKLSLVAQWLPGKQSARSTAFAEQLAALQNDEGGFDDTGHQADRSMSTERQTWSVLALRAAGQDASAQAAVDALLAVQCADGGFATDLSQQDCTTGDPAATGLAVQAVNATVSGDADSSSYTTTAAPTAEAAPVSDGLVRAAQFLYGYGASGDALPASTGTTDWAALSAVASGSQAVGLDATYLADRVAARLHRDGGVGAASLRKPSDVVSSIQAAPALAGRSVLSADGSPLAAATRVPVGFAEPSTRATPASPGDDRPAPAWVVYGLAALLALVLVLAAVLLAVRIVQSGRKPAT